MHCSLPGKFPTHRHLGLCCIHCVFCSFHNSNLPFIIQTYQCSRWRCLFARYFFFRICSLSIASTLPNFVRKQANNLKNYKQWYNLYCLETYKPISALADAVITAKVCSLRQPNLPMLQMKLSFCVMLFLSYLYPTNRFNVAKVHAQISTKLKKQRHWFNIHSLKSYKTLLGPFHVNSQEVVNAPSPIFLKFNSNCHYPIWWTSAKFEWNLSRNGIIIKLFSWGGVAVETQIIHIWPCLKPYYCQTTLVNNPNISGLLVTLPNIEKITLSVLWLSKVKGHGPQNLTVFSSCYKFSKIFKPRHGFVSW